MWHASLLRIDSMTYFGTLYPENRQNVAKFDPTDFGQICHASLLCIDSMTHFGMLHPEN